MARQAPTKEEARHTPRSIATSDDEGCPPSSMVQTDGLTQSGRLWVSGSEWVDTEYVHTSEYTEGPTHSDDPEPKVSDDTQGEVSSGTSQEHSQEVTDQLTDCPTEFEAAETYQFASAIEVGMNLQEIAEHNSKVYDIFGNNPMLEEEIFTGLEVIPDDAFRIQHQRFIVTWARSNFDKTKLSEHLSAIISKQTKKKPKIIVAREKHKDGSFHMHAGIDCGKAFQSRRSSIFNFEGRHPNIRKVIGLIHWANVLCYLGKEDKANRPSQAVLDAALCWNAPSAAAALLSGAYKGDPCKIGAAWEMRPMPELPPLPESQKPWYQKVLKPVLDKPDAPRTNRTWMWFCDLVGNTDKSYTCHHWFRRWTAGERHVMTDQMAHGDTRSWIMTLSDACKEGWSGHAVLIDLPRAFEKNDTLLYQCLELAANGHGQHSKYRGARFDLPRNPIIIVMANWWPRTDGTGSADRWELYEITNDPVPYSARGMNLNEARALRDERFDARTVEALERKARLAEEAGVPIRVVDRSRNVTIRRN